MKILLLSLLLLAHYSYAVCDYGFDRPIDQQFRETLERYFIGYETFKQTEVQRTIDRFIHEERGRKEVLQHLIDIGYLAVENSPLQNRLFNDILSRSSEEVIRAIRGNPDSLNDGTLLNLPPFFLIVFVGEREAMQAGIEIDRTLVNSRNPLQEVPVHYTIDPDIAGDLLHNRARPNEPDKKGRVGLYNMRNPETVKVMLHYNADPMVRDRSGVPLIRYHREQVGNQEIVDLLEQARESQKSMNGTRNHQEFVVPQKTEGEIRVEEARRWAEENRKAEERRVEEEARRAERMRRAEEIREAEAARRAAREEAKKQAKIKSQKRVEEQKNVLISKIAEEMSEAIIMKLLVNGLIQSLTSGTFQYPMSYVQNIKTRADNIVVLQKALEDKLVEMIEAEIMDFLLKPSESQEAAMSKLESYARRVQAELEVLLTDEWSNLSLASLKKRFKKAEKQASKFADMVEQLIPFKQFREGFVHRLAAELDLHQLPKPDSVREFLKGSLPLIVPTE